MYVYVCMFSGQRCQEAGWGQRCIFSLIRKGQYDLGIMEGRKWVCLCEAKVLGYRAGNFNHQYHCLLMIPMTPQPCFRIFCMLSTKIMEPPWPIYYKVLDPFQNTFGLKCKIGKKIHFNSSMNNIKFLLISTSFLWQWILVLKWTKTQSSIIYTNRCF